MLDVDLAETLWPLQRVAYPWCVLIKTWVVCRPLFASRRLTLLNLNKLKVQQASCIHYLPNLIASDGHLRQSVLEQSSAFIFSTSNL
jgi:hypothetical protein